MKLVKIVVSIVMFVLLISVVNAIGIGVSPSELVYSNALKGTTIEKEFKIDNTGAEDIIAVIEIMEYKEWFKLDPGINVMVPAKGSSKVKATVNVPKDIENGDYETMIYVKGKAGEAEGMGLIPGAAFKARIEVIDKEIIKGYVDNILTRDTTLGNNVKFIVGFLNQGNVDVSPNADIIIKKESGENVDSFSRQFEAVKPGESKSLVAEYETIGKPLGKYTADVKVYLNNELLGEKTVYFKILEKMPSEIEEVKEPVAEKQEVKVGVEGKKTSLVIGIIIIIAILAIGLGVYYGFFRKK